jgi:hypothetical protein
MPHILREMPARAESGGAPPVAVVRLTTSAYRSKGGRYVMAREIRRMSRMSRGHDLLSEDVDACGCLETLRRIVNLGGCPDGLYSLELCDKAFDDGYLEDYNYKLVPYAGEEAKGRAGNAR